MGEPCKEKDPWGLSGLCKKEKRSADSDSEANALYGYGGAYTGYGYGYGLGYYGQRSADSDADYHAVHGPWLGSVGLVHTSWFGDCYNNEGEKVPAKTTHPLLTSNFSSLAHNQ